MEGSATWVQVAMILAPAAAALLSAAAAWFSAKAKQLAGEAKVEASAAKQVGQDNAVSLSNTHAALAGNTALTEATHEVVSGRYEAALAALLAEVNLLKTDLATLRGREKP